MFKKRKRPHSSRVAGGGANDDAEDASREQVAPPPPEPAERTSNGKKRTPVGLGMLSFGEAEEGEDATTFELKSGQKGRKRPMSMPAVAEEGTDDAVAPLWGSSSAGRYSASSMEALKSTQRYQAKLKTVQVAADDEVEAGDRLLSEAHGRSAMDGVVFSGERADLLSSLSETNGGLTRELVGGVIESTEAAGVGDHGESYIPLDGNGNGLQQITSNSRIGKLGDHISMEDGDDELDRWEREQISRGAAAGIPMTSEPEAHGRPCADRSYPEAHSGSQGSTESAPPVTLDEVMHSLAAAVETLTQARDKLMRRSVELEVERSACSKKLEEVRSSSKAAAHVFEHFQQVRDYLVDICSMLREKEPMINELHGAIANIEADWCASRVYRRREAVEDDLLDELACDQLKEVLGSYNPMAGGPISLSLLPNASKERIDAGRAQRKSAREAGEGALESEVRRRREAALEASKVVMEDVDGDVKSLPKFKETMELWKRDFHKQYDQAFVSLSIPKLLAPQVRLKLVAWDPLGSWGEPGTLDGFEWYQCFRSYAADIRPSRHLGQEEDVDPDQELIKQVMEQQALPLLQSRLMDAYDPVMEGQTAAAAAAVSQILELEPSAEAAEALLLAPLPSIRAAVDSTCVPILPSGCPSLEPLVLQQIRAALELVKNIVPWSPILPPHALVPLAVGRLLSQRVAPALLGVLSAASEEGQRMARDLCGAVEELLPQEWKALGDYGHHVEPFRAAQQ
jgi:GC-rich sequence DNA-binding factor